MRLRFVWIIVPSLLLLLGCSQKKSGRDDQAPPAPQPHHPSSFTLTDIDGRTTTLKLREGQLYLKRVMQPIVIVHLFSTRTPLCQAMLPYLSDLQHARRKEIFVLGLVVPEHLDTVALRRFMQRNQSTFFISNSSDNAPLASALADMLQLGSNYPLPTTLIFERGKLIADYEGLTPIEMIQNDLAAHPPSITKRK